MLWDGVPVNDPFGGWVYWTRIPPEQIDRVEISRGASTSVFGDRAMSGAIAVLSREIDRFRYDGSYEAGNRNTHEIGGGIAGLWRRFASSARIRAFTTEGYFIVPANIRGPVDTRANVDFVAGNTRLDILGGEHRFFAKLDVLAEQRDNGTTITRNHTNLGTISGTYSWQRAHDGISVMGFHTREEFHASFSAIGAGRRTETLSFLQQVPSQSVGGAALWSHSASRFNTVAGFDLERAQGTSTDRLNPTGLRIGGGNRLQRGFFGQLNFKAGPAQFFLGAREHFIGSDDNFFSPSGGIVLSRGPFRFRGSGYRSFRAPTLNELYREFRAGNAITRANPLLRPETQTGGEFGVDYIGETRRFGLTFFRNSLEGLITNVTLQTGATIIRQRQNASDATAQGIEAEFNQRWRNFRFEASYLYAESTYVTRLRIPQVPRSQGSAQVSYSRDGTLLSAGMRTYSLQFEDDLNNFILPGFATYQAAARQRLINRLSATFALENAFDRVFLTAAGANPTIGAPRLIRIGLRWN